MYLLFLADVAAALGGHIRQLHLGRVGHGILPDGGVAAPAVRRLVDAQAIAGIHSNPGIPYIFHRNYCAELSGPAADKNIPQADLPARRQQIHPKVTASYIDFFDIDAELALSAPRLQFDKAYIFTLHLALIGVDVRNQSPII